ncbi:MAG: alpha/beta fold hydrolase, partial [Gemmataceae bacterium]
QVPTLILVGQEDVPTPPGVAEIMRSKIRNATLVELPQAGHMANLEAPGPFNDAVAQFVAGL